MAREPIRACVFDAYGTLFDLRSLANGVEQPTPLVAQVLNTWRTKQLEYAWVSTLRRRHESFWSCTTCALDYALIAHGAPKSLRNALLPAYAALDAFPDAVDALQRLRRAARRTAVLSNGSPDLLFAALWSAKLEALLDACISVESAGAFKPAPQAYALAVDALGERSASIAFVTSNAWDAVGALDAGFRTFWVNRNNWPVEYALTENGVEEVRSLMEAAEAVLSDVSADV